MENNNYEEYLKQRTQFVKERYLKEFEKYPVGESFRKVKFDMECDYEFLDNVGMPAPMYFNPRSKRNDINSMSLYFVKVNNNICEEYVTGKKFIRFVNPKTGTVCFYNEETGLYFDFSNYFEKAVGMILDDVYTYNVIPFFEYYEELKKEDNRLRSKSVDLMLRKQLKHTK